MKCENCSKINTGLYGSGRFCSEFCVRSYSAKKNQHRFKKRSLGRICQSCQLRFPSRIKIDGILRNLGNRKYCLNCSPFKSRHDPTPVSCLICRLELSQKRELNLHFQNLHPVKRIAWNKGLTKETDGRIAKYSQNISKTLKRIGHRSHIWNKKSLMKLSKSMKLAHAEGRAHNIGSSRWKNEPSYPEKFFMEVIKNEFNDKDYVREHPVGIYSIDFAWINKKMAIEIDGRQHEQPAYRARDLRKDRYLRENGWKVLRIEWVEIYKNTREWINNANNFIGKVYLDVG